MRLLAQDPDTMEEETIEDWSTGLQFPAQGSADEDPVIPREVATWILIAIFVVVVGWHLLHLQLPHH